MLCVLVYRKAAMRSAINLLVAQLALSDLLLSALVVPYSLVSLFLPADLGPWGRPLCGLEAFLREALVSLNTFLLVAISLDRCLIIVHRKDKLNVRRARVIISGAWCLSVLCCLPPVLGWGSFGAYPGLPPCVRFTSDLDATDLSFVVVKTLLTRYAPLVAILYSYARIVSTVREKNRKVHHYGPDLGISHRGGTTLPPASPRHRASVIAGLADLPSSTRTSTVTAPGDRWCVVGSDSRSESSGVTSSSFSSSSSVSFVSSSSAVYLHSVCCLRLVDQLGLSGTALPGPCTACSAVPKSLACPSKSSVLSHNGARNDTDGQHVSGPKTSVDNGTLTKSDPSKDCVQVSSSFPALSLRKVVQRSRSYLSSPSGFSPTSANHSIVRRTAAARRQVLDMSFKTRSFQTILVLSLLLCSCWMPYVTAAMVTSLTEKDPTHHDLLLCLLLWLGFLKSAINPLVYCVRIRKFRDLCKTIVPKACYSYPGGVPCVDKLVKRRVNPSAMYQCSDTPVS